jgi:hypothetical protein
VLQLLAVLDIHLAPYDIIWRGIVTRDLLSCRRSLSREEMRHCTRVFLSNSQGLLAGVDLRRDFASTGPATNGAKTVWAQVTNLRRNTSSCQLNGL